MLLKDEIAPTTGRTPASVRRRTKRDADSCRRHQKTSIRLLPASPHEAPRIMPARYAQYLFGNVLRLPVMLATPSASHHLWQGARSVKSAGHRHLAIWQSRGCTQGAGRCTATRCFDAGNQQF